MTTTRRAPTGPLAGSYGAAVALVVLALVPFLLVTAALLPLAPVISHSVGLSTHAFNLAVALSDGAYAFGTVLAVQFAVHLRPRRMLLIYVSVFVVASVLAAWAPAPGVFVAALVVQGLCTSLMLIAAVPPLVTGWPPAKMPVTGAIMNLCVFGAVAVGPSVGGFQAASGGWRPLFWGVAAVGAVALLAALATFEDDDPADPDAPWDFVAIALAAVGCAAAFYGAGELQTLASPAPVALVPLIGGAVLLAALVVYQYRVRRPLMPVRQLATTIPTTGILIATFASAAAFGLMELVLTALHRHGGLNHTALLFLPEFAAAVATAVLFGLLFRTRFTPVLALSGMVLLAAAAVVATGMAAGGQTVPTAVAAGLIGLGVGASVSPALFLAGFSLRSTQIQRVFALIELLRGVTAFLVAPVLVYLATVIGLRTGMWICGALAAAGALIAAAVFAAGRGRLQVPDLERWQHGEPAWASPPLWDRFRRTGDLEGDTRSSEGETAVPSGGGEHVGAAGAGGPVHRRSPLTRRTP